jgi:hypothetical protein
MSNLAEALIPWAERRKRIFEANIVTNPKHPSPMSWSWQSIQAVYQVLGHQLDDYKDIADRFEIHLPIDPTPGAMVPIPVGAEDFIHHWYNGVVRINGQLKVLDQEIARRNELIGVMG